MVEATDRNIIVQNITYNIQDSAVAGDISPPKPPEQESRKPPVRRRKAVKKANPAERQVPEVEPEPTSAQYEEDEDFSDFSF